MQVITGVSVCVGVGAHAMAEHVIACSLIRAVARAGRHRLFASSSSASSASTGDGGGRSDVQEEG